MYILTNKSLNDSYLTDFYPGPASSEGERSLRKISSGSRDCHLLALCHDFFKRNKILNLHNV